MTALTPRRFTIALRVVSVPIVAVVLAAGVWVTGGSITNDFRVSMALTAGWFVLCAAGCAIVAIRVPWLRLPVLAGYVVAATAIGGYLGLTTLRDRVVDERVVAGTPQRESAATATAAPRSRNVELFRGRFRSGEHSTTGTASIVRLSDGRRFLTLTAFSTSPGPDLRVRLVAGNSDDGGAAGAVDLGTLKGNRGDQQYAVPRDVRLAGRTVVIWCRAFSAPFGSARLV